MQLLLLYFTSLTPFESRHFSIRVYHPNAQWRYRKNIGCNIACYCSVNFIVKAPQLESVIGVGYGEMLEWAMERCWNGLL
jgi:hypothetical protein